MHCIGFIYYICIMEFRTAKEMAITHIAEYTRGKGYIFTVNPSCMDNKKIRRLNKELGLMSVNHLGNTNGCKK